MQQFKQILESLQDNAWLSIPIIVLIILLNYKKEVKYFVNNKIKLSKKNTLTLEDISNQLTYIKNRVDNIDKRQQKDEFLRTLNYRLKEIVNSIIDAYPQVNDNIESILLDGADKAADLFIEIKTNGYERITNEYVKRSAIQKLKSLSSNYGGSSDDEVALKIKTQVAYPAINKLLSDLQAFKKGVFNGVSDEKFAKLAKDFVRNVSNDAITIYLEENSK